MDNIDIPYKNTVSLLTAGIPEILRESTKRKHVLHIFE